MKKLLYFVLTAALLFGCKKDDNGTPCPVSGATLPTSSAENPIQAGSAVTIQGSGFTAGSEIWLRALTKTTDDVQATVTGHTSTSITFTAPTTVSGEQSIILKQDGGEWPLGKMYFAAAPDILPKKIVKSVLTDDEGTYTANYSYDDAGRLTRIDETGSNDFKYEFTITYAEDQVTLTETDLQNSESTETHTFRLHNGRAESYIYEDHYTSEFDESDEAEISYGENGYLKEIVSKWTNGSATSTVTVDETGFLKKFDARLTNKEDGDETGTINVNFDPNTAVRNNLNLDLMYISEVMHHLIDQAVLPYGYLLGICGKRMTCLPQQYTWTGTDEEGTDTWTEKLNYIFDGEYISKIEIDYGNGNNVTIELFYEE